MAQSQDSQSVAEAARRAREQKKAPAKPAKIITEDDVKPAAPADQAAPASSGSAPASSAPAGQAAAPAGSSATEGPKDEKASKEAAELKELIKQVQSDLELLQREQSLEQDSYFSNPDYVHDAAGKAKLDATKQRVGDTQQDLDRLKARLAELLQSQGGAAATPPKS